MNADQARALREPFPEEAVGKLPRLTCKACIDGKGSCAEHRKAKCQTCGAYTSPQHIHLDYVGHAATTDRLLQVDPDWTWEPVSLDEAGLPAFDQRGGLWVHLTVAGVTRLGYGDSGGKNTPDGVKEAIGDAIRNGAMRFGVALDLWSKEDLASSASVRPGAAPGDPSGSEPSSPLVEHSPGNRSEEVGSTGDAAYGEGADALEGATSSDQSSELRQSPGASGSDSSPAADSLPTGRTSTTASTGGTEAEALAGPPVPPAGERKHPPHRWLREGDAETCVDCGRKRKTKATAA